MTTERTTLTLGGLRPGVRLDGILPGKVVTVVSASPMGDAVRLFYMTSDGSTGQEIVDADTLHGVHVVRYQGLAPTFDADPAEFKLAAEALRIRYAAQYDPMEAVYSSNIDPLPHQIRAVYEDMLPKVPLRFLLADDPGSGKTIMAGLYIKEMMMRSAAERVIVVCPGGLAEQWHDEMESKFSLRFDVFSPDMRFSSPSGNPFRDHDYLIVRMDQVARNEDLLRMMQEVSWDIAVVDEAHRMSAHYKNTYGEVERTSRFHLGETLASTSENLLLMTATPHSGKEQDFQLFLSLLDRDRFAGRYQTNRHHATDTKGLMRRMVKEDLLRFDGKPLFPERHAQTVIYELSRPESELYRNVTDYVRSGMNAAAKIMQSDGRRGNSIGFALTILQRRLASSPEAILRSLERRRARLQDVLKRLTDHPEEFAAVLESQSGFPTSMDVFDEMWEDNDESEQGGIEERIDRVVDSATAAESREELEAEIHLLDGLIRQASKVRVSNVDAKWSQLSDILQHHVLDSGTSDLPHKMIVFTEHRDTLSYLSQRISTLLGRSEAVCVIHGGMNRGERKTVQERFINDPHVRIMVATDAAGEGLNLQRADLMVNYDLPWNPNRIEQRFGRIHRIGQKRVCYLWNLVAKHTREGEVYATLLDKIATIDHAYGSRLFNVLGEGKAFDGRPLRDLMIEAIRYGDDPKTQAKLQRIVNSGVSKGLDELVKERSAHPEMYPTINIEQIRDMIERARERKLQPGYIAAFFLPAFIKLGGGIHQREANRWEITHVPAAVMHKAESLNRHRPLAHAYERVVFDTKLVAGDSGKPEAELISPGTPLLDAVTSLIVDRYGTALDRGTVFVDRTDTQPDAPMLMMAAEQKITDAYDRPVSQHFDYLQVGHDGKPFFSPAPPYLDYDGPKPCEVAYIGRLLKDPWLMRDYTTQMGQYVYEHGTKPRLIELQERKSAENRHVREQVSERLHAEIEYWYQQYNQLSEDERNGRPKRHRTASAAKKRAESYEERWRQRDLELSQEVRFHAKSPVIRGMALVVPARLIEPEGDPGVGIADVERKSRLFAKQTKEVDDRAVALTMVSERAIGRYPTEMPHNNKGYDIRSKDDQGRVYFIEVKGRIALPEADTFTVTASEVAFAKSQDDRHRLSLVRVSPLGADHDEIRYIEHAFSRISQSSTTISYNEVFADYWNRGTGPC